MQNAPREHSAILLTFIKPPLIIKIFVLSIFEWLFYTGFTVHVNLAFGTYCMCTEVTFKRLYRYIQGGYRGVNFGLSLYLLHNLCMRVAVLQIASVQAYLTGPAHPNTDRNEN